MGDLSEVTPCAPTSPRLEVPRSRRARQGWAPCQDPTRQPAPQQVHHAYTRLGHPTSSLHRGVDIAKDLKAKHGPKLKDFRDALLSEASAGAGAGEGVVCLWHLALCGGRGAALLGRSF